MQYNPLEVGLWFRRQVDISVEKVYYNQKKFIDLEFSSFTEFDQKYV